MIAEIIEQFSPTKSGEQRAPEWVGQAVYQQGGRRWLSKPLQPTEGLRHSWNDAKGAVIGRKVLGAVSSVLEGDLPAGQSPESLREALTESVERRLRRILAMRSVVRWTLAVTAIVVPPIADSLSPRETLSVYTADTLSMHNTCGFAPRPLLPTGRLSAIVSTGAGAGHGVE